MNNIVDWLMGKEENIKKQEWNILTPCNRLQFHKSRIGNLELQEHQRLLYEKSRDHLKCSHFIRS